MYSEKNVARRIKSMGALAFCEWIVREDFPPCMTTILEDLGLISEGIPDVQRIRFLCAMP